MAEQGRFGAQSDGAGTEVLRRTGIDDIPSVAAPAAAATPAAQAGAVTPSLHLVPYQNHYPTGNTLGRPPAQELLLTSTRPSQQGHAHAQLGLLDPRSLVFPPDPNIRDRPTIHQDWSQFSAPQQPASAPPAKFISPQQAAASRRSPNPKKHGGHRNRFCCFCRIVYRVSKWSRHCETTKHQTILAQYGLPEFYMGTGMEIVNNPMHVLEGIVESPDPEVLEAVGVRFVNRTPSAATYTPTAPVSLPGPSIIPAGAELLALGDSFGSAASSPVPTPATPATSPTVPSTVPARKTLGSRGGISKPAEDPRSLQQKKLQQNREYYHKMRARHQSENSEFWTPEEDQKLLDMWWDMKDEKEIAKELGKAEAFVRIRRRYHTDKGTKLYREKVREKMTK